MRAQTEQLREIAEIRVLLCVAAEARACRAGAAHNQALDDKQAREHEQALAETSWRSALSAPALRMELVALWGAELRRREAGCKLADQELSAAAAELERRTLEWRSAEVCCGAATSNLRIGERGRSRREEERSLADISDLFAQGWSSP